MNNKPNFSSIDYNDEIPKHRDNLEPLTLICLDENFNSQETRSIIDYIHCFDHFEECEQFIINPKTKNDRLFFIVSSTYVTNIVSHVHDLIHIIAIYIFQRTTSNDYRKDTIDDRWTRRYPKVKGIYLDRDSLLSELSSDVEIYANSGDLLPMTVYDVLQSSNSSTDHLRFLFYQLFFRYYCFDASSLNKNHLMKIAEDYYRSNQSTIDQIKEFNRKYQPKKHVLSWFLRQSFLQRLLTQSLMKLDLKMLFALRFFIRDLSNKMMTIDGDECSLNEEMYYRSQILSEETFGRIKGNLGELLSINHFFSARKDRHQSLVLMRRNISAMKSIYRVLFEIQIPRGYSRRQQRPFMDITQFTSEKNTVVLFLIGSIFRIKTVVFDINNECWIIQLSLYDERVNNDFSQLFTFLNENHSPIILANLLRQISPHSAEQFCRHLLREKSQSISKLEYYHGLGLCSYSRTDYQQAFLYFEKALEIESDDRSIKSSLHNSIGLVHAQQNNLNQAYIHFSQALKMSSLPLHIACVHHNLALIYSQQGLHEKELDHYQKALAIRTNHLSSNHLQIASLLNNIGIVYGDLQQYDQALINLRKALEMRLKLLAENHIDVARSYANIGVVYAKTEEFRMALEYLKKAQLLLEDQQSIPQGDIEQIKKNIRYVNHKHH